MRLDVIGGDTGAGAPALLGSDLAPIRLESRGTFEITLELMFVVFSLCKPDMCTIFCYNFSNPLQK